MAQLAEGGPRAISLRSIARSMGMTAGAIYSYFDTRDDLISSLVADIYHDLAEHQEAAFDLASGLGVGDQLLAVAESYRSWGLANPAAFRLVYGDPIQGYRTPASGAAAEAEQRACAVLTSMVWDAWPPSHGYAPGDYTWSDFSDDFGAIVRGQYPGLPPAAVAFALRVWGRMHGLVTLEIYEHLQSQMNDPGRLYRDEIIDIIRALGLPPGAWCSQ